MLRKQSGLLFARISLLVVLFVVALLLIADSHESEAPESEVDVGEEATTESVQDVLVDEEEVGTEADEIDPTSVEAGEIIALEFCTACHGTDGNATIATNGNLAGQNERYLYQQLVAIKAKSREIIVMGNVLNDIDDDGLLSLARYYASLPGRIGQADPETDLTLGESIYRGGILEKEVAACTACHAPNGNGNLLAGFPRVSGQPSAYLELQLKAYREDERTTDEDYGGMMRDIAKKLTDGEISAVANYITGLY